MRAWPAVRIDFVPLAAFGLALAVSLVLTVRADDGRPRERVIVMNSGRILTGQMTRNAGGWLVEQASGRVQVPEVEVKLVADNLREAYRRQRDSIVEPTPATHMMLAQWCISYRLHDEARDELKKCLKRDPDHDEARKLLRRLDESLTVKPVAAAAVSPWKTPDGFVVPDVESLGGFSKETATAFTTRVQPLLMNKCGNASCHGAASGGEFKLHSIRSGSNGHRMYTERNLAEVLRYIDIHDPALSPLVAVPQGSHGGTGAIFHGPQSAEQIKTLRNFIKLVAREKQIEERELPQQPSVLDNKKPVSGQEEALTIVPSGPSRRDIAVTPAAAAITTAQRPRVTTADEREIGSPQTLPDDDTAESLDNSSRDAFDPDVFNRRFHGAKKVPQ